MPAQSATPSTESDWGTGRMDLIYFSNEFPKEDLQLVVRRLHTLSKYSRHSILAQFILEATRSIKDEVRKLPTGLRELFPPFKTVLDWSELTELREGALCGAIDGVLLIMVQVAAYIVYIEDHPHKPRDLAYTAVAGLGVGLLSSTAAALSPTPADLPLTGADAVRLAFRMGIHVQAVSESLEARGPKPDTWAYVVYNVSEANAQKELDTVQSREQLPVTDKIFISAVNRTSVTISGPPSRLKQLFNAKSRFFRTSRSIALPVYGGMCHAPHVYGPEDVLKIVQNDDRALHTLPAEKRVVIPLYSTSTGRAYPFRSASELLEGVVSELLTQAIRWDDVIAGITNALEVNSVSEVTIHNFGNSVPLSDLTASISNTLPEINLDFNNFISLVIDESSAPNERPRGTAQAKLAIVGMSCRMPGGATNTDKFWEILEQGLDVSRQIPADRFDVKTHFDPTGKELNKSMTEYGCFIDEPGMFDAPFFNMSPREAEVVDPQMRLALVTAFEALERSGYVGNRTAATQLQRIGTYYGQAADDYREVNQGQEVSTYYIPGGCRAFGPGRINYFFKFSGPSYSIDTACSSGLAAIEVACQALWNGDVDMAVAGGVNILTNPDGFAGLCNGHFLTKGHNACKTWDINADGYCRADGVGSVVIKRLEDAEADNDNILAVVLAAGTNHSAEAISITHPHAGHQSYLSRQVIRQAGIDPLDVSYIELHGTGTQAGDFEEMTGILDVYAPLTKRRSEGQPLHIGSVKSNVGHSESAAGTTALLKVLLMMQNNKIPPHIGIKTEINPRFPRDGQKRNLHIPFEVTPWTPSPKGKKRIAAVNNFGAAGGNTMMILEDAPGRDTAVAGSDPRGAHVVAVSAKTKRALSSNIANLLNYLDKHGENVQLPSLAYTTTARKYHYQHRVAFAAVDVPNLQKQLAASLAKVQNIKPVGKSGTIPPLAFAFTGQGASYKSMSLELYRDGLSVFHESIDHLDSLAQKLGFPSFIPALDGSHPRDHAHPPVITQLALVCSQIALIQHWAALGVKPDLVVGHSLGEYAALHAAGVLTATDTIYMVGRRAQMLQDRCTIGSHTMVAVRAAVAKIQEFGKPFTISCINGPTDTVISGTQEQMVEITGVLEAAGIRCIALDVAFAFHSQQTDPILEEFEAVCKGVLFQEPKIPVISPLLGKVVFDGKTFNANYMRRATREAVDFVSALENAQKIDTLSDGTMWIELGPHPVCAGFLRSILPSVIALPSLRRGDDNWTTMAQSMSLLHQAGINVNWDEFHRPFKNQLQLLDLPTYAFDEKVHWLPYVGDWCLTKGNTFYAKNNTTGADRLTIAAKSEISTSTVQQIVEVNIDSSAGVVVMQSDLMHPDFLAAAHGHRMNGCGVVTSSIHADIAYTLGEYLYRKFFPRSKHAVRLNVANLAVTKGLVAQEITDKPQLIRVTAFTSNIHSGVMGLTWQNVNSMDGSVEEEPFATAKLLVGDAHDWLLQWEPMAHLVHGRIEALERLASEGRASRFSGNMAYTLFGSNLVDYAEKYRGMQSVVMHEFEGCADVQLTTKESGSWTIPPYFIDSVAHLAGFIMNCSDAMDTKNNYCVTPGWKSMRFAEPLVAGMNYKSYVKMIPTKEDPTVYLGDVYILRQDTSTVIGMVGGIQFRRYPRILLSRFFSPPDQDASAKSKPKPAPATKPAAPVTKSAPLPVADTAESKPTIDIQLAVDATTPKAPVVVVESNATTVAAPDSMTAKAMILIAKEAGLEVDDLQDDVGFSDLGIDSLMSLVLSEKFRSELDLKVSSSLFLDYPLIGDFRKWLDEYHS